MVKIHPENIQNGDEMYMLLRSIVCGLLFCVCTCVGLIIIIVSSIENNINDGSS
tara:strand:- start:2435 stop:2596 length:162 start_codon:yes stop_codon:yes gene_type:complete